MGAFAFVVSGAERPELVSALVVEDMAPDFRRTTGPWEPWLRARSEFDLPNRSSPTVAGTGRISTARPPGGGYTGGTARWIEIAAEWGTQTLGAVVGRTKCRRCHRGRRCNSPWARCAMAERDYPTAYLCVPDAGHLVHDEAPARFTGGRWSRSWRLTL